MTHWRCIGSSAAGSRHEREGVPCEDALSFSSGNNWLVAAIADGAGSAPFGGEGARLIVSRVIDHAHQLFADGLPQENSTLRTSLYRLLARVRSDVERTTEATGDLNDYASTVAIAVADGHSFGAIQVGDGAMVVLRENGSLEQIAAPPQPEFVNQTTFMTSPTWRDWVACHVEDNTDIQGIAMTTDGLVSLATKRPGGTPHRPFYEPLFLYADSANASEEELNKFLRSDRVQSATGDDVSLLLATRGQP